MTTTEDSEPVVSTRARRGDLAVVVSRTSTAVTRGESYESVRVALGRVSSITRAGLVKRYETAMFADADDREQKVQPREQVLIVGADSVDVEAVLAQYRERTWQKTHGTGGDMIRPYESLNEARNAIRVWLYSQQD